MGQLALVASPHRRCFCIMDLRPMLIRRARRHAYTQLIRATDQKLLVACEFCALCTLRSGCANWDAVSICGFAFSRFDATNGSRLCEVF